MKRTIFRTKIFSPMLVKTDLQQIRSVVREEVGNEAESIKDDVLSELKMSRIRIQNDIGDLLDRIKNLEIRVRKMNNEEVDDEEK